MNRFPTAALVLASLLTPGTLQAQDLEGGRALYLRWCVSCHGDTGEGDGPAAEAMLPRPRDFAQARYQVRTTGSGELPTDADLLHVIREGLPGTTMPGWPNLTDREQRDVIAYLKSLSRFFEGAAPEAVAFSSDPGSGGDALESGRRAYEALECADCHGAAGRGDGPSAPTLEDWRGFPIRAADLTEGWRLNGGGEVEDIHTRVLTGLDGTPMPAASDAMNAGVVTPEQVWHLAHYVADLGRATAPPVSEVVRVNRVEGELPAAADSGAWAEIDDFYLPLAGQVLETPRNFAPTVDGLWVKGAHNGSELALRIRWSDPSESPDPAWDEWLQKLGATLDFDGAEVPTTQLADVLSVQFPLALPDDTRLPYFLMGGARDPVYQWIWDSQTGVSGAQARGLASVERRAEGAVSGSAAWADGQWTLTLEAPLAPADGGERPAFTAGTMIPIAFAAWDGSSGEVGTRGSVSSWYFMHLEPPTSSAVFITPLVVALLTAGLGLVLVRRARARRAPDTIGERRDLNPELT